MGTKTETRGRVDTKEEAFARAVVATIKVVTKANNSFHTSEWECIDHSIDLAGGLGTSKKVQYRYEQTPLTKIWETAFERMENNDRSSAYYSRLAALGIFFRNNKDGKAMLLYEQYKNKCGVFRMWDIMNDTEGKALKRLERKEARAKARIEANVDEDPSESTVEEPSQTTTKKKEEPKGWTNPKVSGGFNLDRELLKQMKQLYMGEPDKFFQMIARILTADVNPIPAKWRGWRKLAELELK